MKVNVFGPLNTVAFQQHTLVDLSCNGEISETLYKDVLRLKSILLIYSKWVGSCIVFKLEKLKKKLNILKNVSMQANTFVYTVDGHCCTTVP